MVHDTKTCIFCGRGPTSREDVWPTWLTRYIPRSLTSYHNAVAEISPEGEIRKIQKKRGGDPRSRRPRCVCQKCNNEWMSQLQEHTKPLVLKLAIGNATQLTFVDQKQLVVWAIMTTMTSEYMFPDTVAISNRDRQRFYKERTPPKLWKIWIGNFERDDWKPHRIHHAWPVRSRERTESTFTSNTPSNTQTTTLTFGKLYLHVASSDIPDAIRRMTFPDRVTQAILKKIWPARAGTIRWPPRRTMTDGDADMAAGFLYFSMTDLISKRPSIKV
jgi:hypothetical protein